MNDREFRKVYDRAVGHGLAIPESKLTEAVLFEDRERFKEVLKQLSYPCPECAKRHSLSQKDIETLIRSSNSKSLGRIGFTTFCPSSEASLVMDMNFRGPNDYATPIYEIKKEAVEIKVRSLNRLAFESENFQNLSVEELKRIAAYHENQKNAYSEKVTSRALEELQIRELAAPKLEAEAKPKSFLSKTKERIISVLRF